MMYGEHGEGAYESLIKDILNGGYPSGDRTGTGTLKLSGQRLEYPLDGGVLPLLTTKRIPFRLIAEELLWFISGSTNVRDLEERDVRIWSDWRRRYRADRSVVVVKSRSADQSTSAVPGPEWIEEPEHDELDRVETLYWHTISCAAQDSIPVHDDWLPDHPSGLDRFREDVANIPHYHYWSEANEGDFSLEPYYYGPEGGYTPELAVFLHRNERINHLRAALPASLVRLAVGDDMMERLYRVSPETQSRYIMSLWSTVEEISHPQWSLYTDITGDNRVDNPYYIRPSIIEDGDLGPIYGENWRAWPMPDGSKRDQLAEMVQTLKDDPGSRRNLITAWNPSSMDEAALTACHTVFQVVVEGGRLTGILYQRSADMFLGVPFNIASYALLVHMLSHLTGIPAGKFVWMGGDCHVYNNLVEQSREQSGRVPRGFPKVRITRNVKDIDDFSIDDFEVEGYDPDPPIKGEVSV